MDRQEIYNSKVFRRLFDQLIKVSLPLYRDLLNDTENNSSLEKKADEAISRATFLLDRAQDGLLDALESCPKNQDVMVDLRSQLDM